MRQPVKHANEIVLGVRVAMEGAVQPLSKCLASVHTDEGRARVHAYLNSLPFPHFVAGPDSPGLLVRIEEDGSRMQGCFVGREFQAVKCLVDVSWSNQQCAAPQTSEIAGS